MLVNQSVTYVGELDRYNTFLSATSAILCLLLCADIKKNIMRPIAFFRSWKGADFPDEPNLS